VVGQRRVEINRAHRLSNSQTDDFSFQLPRLGFDQTQLQATSTTLASGQIQLKRLAQNLAFACFTFSDGLIDLSVQIIG
jgi:hypothetical protein